MKKYIVIPKRNSNCDLNRLKEIVSVVSIGKIRATVEFDGSEELKKRIRDLCGEECIIEEVQMRYAL